MGGCCSDVRAADTKQNGEHKRRTSGDNDKFGALALKFPLVKKSFKNVKKVFDSHVDDSTRNSVTPDKLGAMMVAMGAKNLTQQDMNELFNMSDLDHSKNISFREFLIAVGVGYYLKEGNQAADSEDKHFEETRRGFLIIREAFNRIDADHGGTVSLVELRQALFQTAGGQQAQDILDARFKELDFDGNGDVNFPEFLYGFAAWVGMDEDDNDESTAESKTY